MRKKNIVFLSLYILSNTLFVLLIVRVCVSLQCFQPGTRIAWLVAAFLACLSGVRGMVGSVKVPLFSPYCWNLEEMREYMKKQSYLDFVLRNVAYGLWVVFLVELCLTYWSLIPFQPAVFVALLAGVVLLAVILALRRRTAQTENAA